MTIQRQPLYFLSGSAQLFGWYHSSNVTEKRNCVAVICPPFGYEYTHAHRAVRHLCDQLALAGVDALRFDYHGTGDSSGTGMDPGRLEQWQLDVVSAVQYAKEFSKAEQCCVIGIRLGGLLATLASGLVSIDYLILWNSVTKGKAYVRELKALAVATNDNASDDEKDALESGGYLISAETESSLTHLNLIQLPIMVKQRALIIRRNDLAVSSDIKAAFEARGILVDQLALPGYEKMFELMPPEKIVVIQPAITEIVAWLKVRVPERGKAVIGGNASVPVLEMQFKESGINLCERVCQFGEDKNLFGILTTLNNAVSDKPTVLLPNSGSVHHVGPGCLYVNLARDLARNGFNCLRFDIEGLGDSVLRCAGWENHPYPDHAVDDVAKALHYMQARWGITSFALGGLCSGAYTSFLAAVELTGDWPIRHVFSINPLTFKWIEGQTLLISQQFSHERWEVDHYKSSARDWKRWIKLFTGKADYLFIVRMVFAQIRKQLMTLSRLLPEVLSGRPTTELDVQFDALRKYNCSISFFIASGDAGYHLILRDGGYFTRRLIKRGRISISHIANADHTFSRLTPRTVLINMIRKDLLSAFGLSPPASD